jgi:hypothetical protein
VNGIELIAQERTRQIEAEGWSPEHDDTHTQAELSRAAKGYVDAAIGIHWALDWANVSGPRYAKRQLYDAMVDTLEELERVRANPVAHHFGTGTEGRVNPPDGWPFDPSWWKPSNDRKANLIKAGALIAAEIDRLQRLETTDNA